MCRQGERDTVNSAEAEACFGDGDYVEAARLLGKVTATVPAFEEVALRFVEVNSPRALQTFLQTKMDALGQDDKAQVSHDTPSSQVGPCGNRLLARLGHCMPASCWAPSVLYRREESHDLTHLFTNQAEFSGTFNLVRIVRIGTN